MMGCQLSHSAVRCIEQSPVNAHKTMHKLFVKKKKSSTTSQPSPSDQGSSTAPKLEISLRSAVLIQRWYRRYLAKIEMKQRYAWKIFQSIEYAGELDQMKLHNFFNALLTHLEPATAAAGQTLAKRSSIGSITGAIGNLDQAGSSSDDELLKATDPNRFSVESTYKGPVLNEDLTRNDVFHMIEGFKSKRSLHIRYVCQILHQALKVLKRKPSLNRVSLVVGGRVTICGDLHGKLDDLLIIFHKNGPPAADNPYVFNGDFVDRGKKSFEVLLVLLLSLVIGPTEIHLNRGNHEDPMMNARYGFTREVIAKYKRHAPILLALIGKVFAWLPLGTVIENKVLVVHGGISNETDLNFIDSIERQKFASILKAPEGGPNYEEHKLMEDQYAWKQILDLLWSDPQKAGGCTLNEFRGGGCYFGPDITEDRLRYNHLDLLIRSHECKSDGYEYNHNGQCLTVFSASNYYGPGSNRGAYVVLQGHELRPYFVQYTAQTKIKYINVRERVGALEASAMNELHSKILLHKNALTQEFQRCDPQSSGLVDAAVWVKTMENHCSAHIPWRMLREKIAPLDTGTGKVKYDEMFQRSMDGRSGDGEGSQSVMETLYTNRERIETIFRTLDKDNSGFLSLDEFADACLLLKNFLDEPIPHDEMVDMARSMDINKDGYIDFNEFLESFRLARIDSA